MILLPQKAMKPLIAALLALASTLALAAPPQPDLPVPSAPELAAKAYILEDFQSGQILAQKNADQREEPASLTKLMTTYLTFTALKQGKLHLSQTLPVSEKAWRTGGSRMFIEPNKPVTVDQLIHGMIVQSGNDATVALAEGIAGSEEGFVQMMNQEAQRLGMKNTHFADATGLPHPQHYSTAHDLALLTSALIRDFPEYYPVFSVKEYKYNNINQPNRDRLLWQDPYVDGLKTGHTDAAGYCLVSSAKRGGRRLISVVLGTDTDSARAMESQRLLNWGFQFFDTVRLYKKDQTVATLPVWKGSENRLRAGFDRDIYIALPKGQYQRLRVSMTSTQPLLAPVNAGQKVGTLRLTLDGKPFAEYALQSLQNVGVGNIFGRAWDSIRLLFK